MMIRRKLTVASVMTLELALGIAWGVILSQYTPALVDQGVEGSLYGLLALLASVSSMTAMIAAGRLYDSGFKELTPIASCLLLAAGSSLMMSGNPIASIAIGASGGMMAVTAGYAASSISRGDYRVFASIYSSSLLGLSIGSLLVGLGLVSGPGIAQAIAIASSTLYAILLRSLRESESSVSGYSVALSRSFRLGFIITALALLGFSYGILSTLDYQVYVASSDASKVALLLSATSLLSAASSISLAVILRSSDKAHIASILAQSIASLAIALSSGYTLIAILYSLRGAVAVIADSTLDSIITRLAPAGMRASILSLSYTILDASGGLGKLAASTLPHYYTLILPIASLLMTAYTIIMWSCATLDDVNTCRSTSAKLSHLAFTISRSLRYLTIACEKARTRPPLTPVLRLQAHLAPWV